MAEMSREQEARLIEKHCQSNCGAGWLTVKAMMSGTSALRRLDALEEWVDKWLAWSPPAIEGNDTGRMWRTHQSKVMLKAFKAALTGDMQMPPESEGT